MSPAALDLRGQTFGRLLVVGRYGFGSSGKSRWRCVCACGRTTTVNIDNLKTGHTSSCGCAGKLKHGHNRKGAESKTHNSWRGMLRRCLNPKAPGYQNYGGRGIKVCARWLKFENFLADMGPRPPDRSIDRINVNGNYEPSNCRWATASEQMRNRRPFMVYPAGRAA